MANPHGPSERPWNWCHKCKEPVDLPDNEVSDGEEVRCPGCERTFVAIAFTDGSWKLEARR